jgi:alkylation response protein AidB-like acyl-CoA dehydrogenase
MHAPGVEVRPLVQATGASHFNEVFLDEVRVPVDRVIGEIDEGWTVARTVLASEAGMIGGAGQHSGFDALLGLARSRGRTGDPLVRRELADVWMRERILKFLGWRMQTAVISKRGKPPDPSVIKNFYTKSLSKRLDLAVAMEGAYGLLWGDGKAVEASGVGGTASEGEPVGESEAGAEPGYWPRQLVMQFASKIGGGTEEVHRNNIGERALGLPREPSADHDLPWSQLPKS